MEAVILENVPCYAPSLAYDNSGFHPEALTILSRMERKNFWYRSRNNVLKNIFTRFLKNNRAEVLEVGCGNGTVLSALSELKNLNLTGADIYLSGVKFAKSQVPDVNFMQMNALDIPFENKYDAIGCFDVLEHISDDSGVIGQLHKALKKDAYLFITVPQYPWLWSETDVIDRHIRRYTRKELAAKITRAGFSIRYVNCFAFAVFPVTVLSRFFRKKPVSTGGTNAARYPEIDISPVLNFVLRVAMYADELAYRLHIPLPFGSSLVLVAQKNG